MNITKERHGIDLVIETHDKVFFGRYDGQMADTVLLKDVLEQQMEEGEEREELIRGLVREGFPREEQFRAVAQLGILRIRRLDEVLAG